ncbi:hypothetical protein [Rhizobium sp. SL86]|jgi:hypothetical protein|uniref:hypothetical protein n=1 Tax=Rhizobium sp. SL86 TaxID=2995148 RepID=UPI00227314A6|nr:hypothetical protein [Rhizobium sp. SL86]MCY1664243.1 hypothetical protein [Rhizobium sp. SL86]
MTTITSSTSVYSISSLYRNSKTGSATTSVLDLMEDSNSSGSSSSSRGSVSTASDEASTSSDASLKLSGQLWDLMSSSSSDEEEDQDSINSQSFAYETDEVSTETTTEEEFLSLSGMTLAERIRQQYLDDNDLTEDDLKAMDADQRAKIEDEIREQIEAATKELQGMDGTDLAATANDTSAA